MPHIRGDERQSGPRVSVWNPKICLILSNVYCVWSFSKSSRFILFFLMQMETRGSVRVRLCVRVQSDAKKKKHIQQMSRNNRTKTLWIFTPHVDGAPCSTSERHLMCRVLRSTFIINLSSHVCFHLCVWRQRFRGEGKCNERVQACGKCN